jgi:AraC family transcriptional regulator of adaptative response / DNA-3-methyladenine glycosylase II
VLGQQVSVAAGRTLAIRLVARLGRRIAEGTHGLSHLFPAPADLARADLDGLGLTRARALALQALARAVCQGAVDFSRPVDEVTASLAALPGIGDWTAQYIALRALGEPDAFPAADLVLRRMAGADGSPLSTRELATRSLVWRPWRGYAVFHLWRASGAGTSKVVPQQPRSLGQRARPGTEGSTKRRALGADIRSTYGP